MENLKVLKKIFKARKIIKLSDLKKLGRNHFSNYDYYTPEQVDKLIADSCNELNLINLFELYRTEFGLMARITVTDLDSGESKIFESATAIPEIKATNVAQQIGGCMTYSERYLLMSIYSIKDNNLDFDTPKEEPKKELPWLTEKQKAQFIDKVNRNAFEDGLSIEDAYKKLIETFRMKKAYKQEIEEAMNCDFNKTLNK